VAGALRPWVATVLAMRAAAIARGDPAGLPGGAKVLLQRLQPLARGAASGSGIRHYNTGEQVPQVMQYQIGDDLSGTEGGSDSNKFRAIVWRYFLPNDSAGIPMVAYDRFLRDVCDLCHVAFSPALEWDEDTCAQLNSDTIVFGGYLYKGNDRDRFYSVCRPFAYYDYGNTLD
jgi:hypothetical protein